MSDTKIYTMEELLAIEEEIRQKQAQAKRALIFDHKGMLICSTRNFVNIISGITDFGKIKFNEFKNTPEKIKDGTASPWTDADDAILRQEIEAKYGIYSKQKYDDAMRIYLEENRYHPVKDLVSSLKWDGVSRVCSFLSHCMRADNSAYTREVSRLIFAGGINRLYNPGCKFDEMPVLIGKHQGEGKSTIVRWLALEDSYFSEVCEFEGQKGIEALEGAWICEVSEMLALTKTKEQEAVKSYLSRLNDRYRMPFDKRVTDHPRKCLFIGTTNKEQFLTDKTGNRRFLPVKVWQSAGELYRREAEIKEYIRQCWAEAYELYNKGELMPYSDPEMIEVIRDKQTEATQDDYREGMIRDFLEKKDEVCIPMLWYEALGMRSDIKPTRKDSCDIALIMQGMEGWIKQKYSRKFKDYGSQRYWKKEWIEI